MDQARQTGPALEAMYRFVLWLVPTVEKFSRRQKFLLGDRPGPGCLALPGDAPFPGTGWQPVPRLIAMFQR